MKLRRLLSLIVVGLAAMGLAGVVAQEKKPKMDPAMEAWMKYANPGEHHKHLQGLIGSWDAKTRWRPAPGAPVQESTGEAKHSWVLGGRFVHLTYESKFMEQPFSGIGYIGYDNYKQKYVSVWMDSMGTLMETAQGTSDAAGKVITLRGEYDDPVSGKTKTPKSIYRFTSPNQYVLEMYDTGPDGKEFKALEVVHARKSAAGGQTRKLAGSKKPTK
jgi:hypothetical protein